MNDITTIDSPIINSPYAESRYYYRIERGKPPEKRAGRRPASYFFRVPERAARGRKRAREIELFEESAQGEEYPLALANLLRGRVKEWEAMDYAGASRITRELLELWQREDRRQRLFFAFRCVLRGIDGLCLGHHLIARLLETLEAILGLGFGCGRPFALS